MKKYILDFILVCIANANAVMLAVDGNWRGALWAWAFGVAVVFVVKFDCLCDRGMVLAKEAHDGWGRALERNRQWADRYAKLEQRFK